MKYIFIDIDGTLYSPEINAVPYSAMDAIKKAKDNGHKLFVCTGRSLSAASLFLNLDVDGFVFSVGSVIYVNHKRIFDSPLTNEQVEEIIKVANRNKLGICIEGNAGAYYDERASNHIYNYFASSANNIDEGAKMVIDNGFFTMENRDLRDHIYKACLYAKNENEIEKVKNDMPEGFQCLVTMRNMELDSICAEVTLAAITKSTAAQIVCESYGATLNDAIAIGDSLNDFEMIKDCGIGVAMGNGCDEIKEIAQFVTTDILEDGIYNAFKHLELI